MLVFGRVSDLDAGEILRGGGLKRVTYTVTIFPSSGGL